MSNEIVPRQPGKLAVATPDYLKVDKPESIDNIKQYIRPPRIKILQDSTDSELKKSIGPAGTVALMPAEEVLNKIELHNGVPNEEATPPFFFTPIFFYVEFICMNPIQMKGTLPTIRSRSFDDTSEEARRSRDFNARVIPCPENEEYDLRFLECMNYVIMVDGQEEPCVYTFSKGEFKAGRRFAELIKARGKVELFANRFAAYTAFRTGKKGEWWGLDIANPNPDETSPWVAADSYEVFKTMYEDLKEGHSKALLQVDYDDGYEDSSSTVSETADTI